MELINGNPNGKHMLEVTQQMMADYKAKYPNGKLDILERKVNGMGHSFGTIHCAGGWDAVLLCDNSKPLDFESGADTYAELIGFRSLDGFEEWADENPLLWGNNRGCGMFLFERAYASPTRPEGAKSYLDVLDHRIEVAKRLIELQNPA